MARYTGSKNKLSRREGFDLFDKGDKLRRANVKPGTQIKSRPKKLTDYGKQLRSKQRAKRFYGVMEKQFRNYVNKATKTKGKSNEVLISLLERRLDNVVYRLGLAPTRPAARQLITHGHVQINEKKISVPSYQVSVGEIIGLSDTAIEVPYIKELLEQNDIIIPDWLERNKDKGKIIRDPTLLDVREPISVIDIIEFYSR